MKLSNSICVVVLFLVVHSVLDLGICQAQMQRMDYETGTLVEVEFMGQWYEAEVLEILGGGMMLRAEFTKRRGNPRDFMFPSTKVRALESPEDAETTDENLGEENPFENAEEFAAKSFAEKEIESDPEVNPFTAESAVDRRRKRANSLRENGRDRQRSSAARKRLPRESPKGRDDGAEAKRKKGAIDPREQFARESHQQQRVANRAHETKSIGVWRWASFGGLSFVGIGLALWGFLNRRIYW
jgi:hypothetical protein